LCQWPHPNNPLNFRQKYLASVLCRVSGHISGHCCGHLENFACDHSHERCIFNSVTTSCFQIDVPQTLLALARAGDLGAFEQLYRRFERPVYTLALRLLGEPEAARDVLHDAMLKVFQRINTFRGEAPFWGWLRQIALNEALMRLRQHDRAETSDELDAFVDDAPGPWVHADASTLERALARLPAQTRSVLWLYHVEGYSHPEIAALVGKTVSFSKSQVARGTQRLREIIELPAGPVSCLIATAN